VENLLFQSDVQFRKYVSLKHCYITFGIFSLANETYLDIVRTLSGTLFTHTLNIMEIRACIKNVSEINPWE